MIRVLVADDQPLVRAGLRALLESDDDLQVVGEAADGAEAVERALAARPDVVLMDIRMPVLDGLEATRRIVADELLAGVHVVVLTTFDLDEYVYEALRAGASGFLAKDVDPAQLRHAVRVVARGDALLALVGEGLGNDDIAARLYMSPATATTHVSRIMTKLAVHDRAQLVVLAYETGLIRPGWP